MTLGETDHIELLLDETEDPYMGPIDYEIAAWIEERVPYTQNLEPCRCIAFRERSGPILYGEAFIHSSNSALNAFHV